VARREEILEAAATVFHEKGYDAGSLDDVADALDLRRASLYYYVQSKANLLYMLFERGLDVALSELDEHSQIEDPRERLEALIRHQVQAVAGSTSLLSVFFDDRTRLEQRYEADIRKRERQYFDAIYEAVQAATDAGVLSGSVRYNTQAILGMTLWTYKWFQPDRDDPDLLANACVELVLGPKPQKLSTARPAKRPRR
jgi:AcrR family transcriptional regulator